VLYLERAASPPLNRFVRSLWYAKAPQVAVGHERILPSGCVQIILNLARDYVLDCPEDGPPRALAASLIVGGYTVYEIVDTSDMTDLMGVVFELGGFAGFALDAVDRFSNRSVALEDVLGSGANGLRDRLREETSPAARFRRLEGFLRERFRAGAARLNLQRQETVEFALRRFMHAPSLSTVRTVAESTGWSERRFSQVFREQVGHSPKVWCRIQRFQRAVRALHRGTEVRWSELALDCGFYDQSHFANEFRAFSGVDATTYSAQRTRWANHMRVD